MLVNCNPLRKLGFISRRHGGLPIARWEEIAEEIFGSSRLSIQFTRRRGERGNRHPFYGLFIDKHRMLFCKLRYNKLLTFQFSYIFLWNLLLQRFKHYILRAYYRSYLDPVYGINKIVIKNWSKIMFIFLFNLKNGSRLESYFLLVSFETLRIMRYRKDLSLKSSKIRINLDRSSKRNRRRESARIDRVASIE